MDLGVISAPIYVASLLHLPRLNTMPALHMLEGGRREPQRREVTSHTEDFDPPNPNWESVMSRPGHHIDGTSQYSHHGPGSKLIIIPDLDQQAVHCIGVMSPSDHDSCVMTYLTANKSWRRSQRHMTE